MSRDKNRDPADFSFAGKNGETLLKKADELGESFALAELQDCSVFLLGVTPQVQIDDCVGCKLFIGPCDGSVFIRDCTDCTVVVAARQLRLRDCKNLDISVYCATQPIVESSTAVTFSPWRGAYPGLSEHFQIANMDPNTNSWDKVYDFTPASEGDPPHWSIATRRSAEWVTVDLIDGVPDNPVPLPDGTLYTPAKPELEVDKNPEALSRQESPHTADPPNHASNEINMDRVKNEEIELPGVPSLDFKNPVYDTGSPAKSSGGSALESNPLFADSQSSSPIKHVEGTNTSLDSRVCAFNEPNRSQPPTPDHKDKAVSSPVGHMKSPQVVNDELGARSVGKDFSQKDWAKGNQDYLSTKQKEERDTKHKMQECARKYIDEYLEERSTRLSKRREDKRLDEAMLKNVKAERRGAANIWAAAIAHIDFSSVVQHAVDMTRFRSLLYLAKDANMPVVNKWETA